MWGISLDFVKYDKKMSLLEQFYEGCLYYNVFNIICNA